jgi:hypothetical protein
MTRAERIEEAARALLHCSRAQLEDRADALEAALSLPPDAPPLPLAAVGDQGECPSCATLRARVAELEAERAGYNCVPGLYEITQQRDAALARVGVLEAALRQIANNTREDAARIIARAALSSPPPHDGEGKP